MLPFFAALALGAPVHVQASLLNAREAPDPDAAVAAWLRIGTAVDVVEEKGDWVRVRVAGRPDEHPVEGWVMGRFLDAREPTVESLAAEPDERTRTERTRALKGEVAQPGRTLVAACAGGRAELLGEIGPTGTFVDRSISKPSPFELMELSAHHWTETRPNGTTRVVAGSPFVRPFRTERWNEEGGSPWAAGSCTDLCEEPSHVILGPCETDGAVFTSRPATGRTPATLGLTEAAEWAEQTNETSAWWELEWVLRRGSAEARFPLAEAEPGSERPDVWPARTFFEIPGVGSYGVSPMRRPTVRGWVLVEIRPESVRDHTLYLEGWGC